MEGVPALQAGGRYLVTDPPDADGDGVRVCQGDFNDGDSTIHPGAVELPGNAADENGDGLVSSIPSAFYKSHGQFVRCVSQECGALVAGGSVSQAECDAIINQAAQSSMGRRQRTRTPPTRDAP